MNFRISLFALLFSVGTNGETTPCSEMNPANLQKEFCDMSAKVNALEQQILEQRSKERTTVAFTAAVGGGSKAIGPFPEDTTLIYKVVKTNIGNAYSSSTGIFTAPVAGVYYFTLFYHAGGAKRSELNLYKNDDLMLITSDHQSDADTADNGGNAVLLQLQQGDRVYVQIDANSHLWGNDYHTTFSGFLVNEMQMAK